MLCLDPRALGLFRIGLGVVVLLDFAGRLGGFAALYTDEGVWPIALALPEALGPSLFLASGSVAWTGAVFALGAAAAVALTLGFHTRTATACTWLVLVSLQSRNEMVFHTGDVLLRVLLFWALFLPLGARFSADGRARQPDSTPVFSIGTVALVLQLFFFFAFLLDHKLLGTSWKEGSAAYWALSVEQLAFPWTQGLLAHEDTLRALTWGVLAQQALAALGLLSPWRVPLCRLAVSLSTVATQVGFAVCLWVGTFPLVTTVAMVALLPAPALDWLERRRGRVAPDGPRPAAAAGPSRAPEWVAGLALLSAVFVWNLGEAGATVVSGDRDVEIRDTWLGSAVLFLRLDQRWSMFAPNPQTEEAWLTIEGTWPSGAHADLTPGIRSADAKIPAPTSHRWAMYYLDLAARPTGPGLEGLARYVCRTAHAPEGPQEVAIFDHRFDRLPGGSRTPTQTSLLATTRCAAPAGPRLRAP